MRSLLPTRRTITLVVAAASLFIGPNANAAAAPASAATTPSAAIPASQPSAKTTTTSTTAKTAPRQLTKPQQPAKATGPAPLSATALRAARAASFAAARPHTTVLTTCSGALSPDVVYSCNAPSSTGTDSYTITLADAQDLLVFQVLATNGRQPGVSITPPSGTVVSCQPLEYGWEPQCAASAAGTYTVTVTNGSTDYTISYLPVLSDTTCTAVDTSFDSTTALQGTVPAGSAGACFALNEPSGHVLHVEAPPSGFGMVTVFDSTGTQICVDDSGDCTLTGTAPYRLVNYFSTGAATAYALRMYDITDPSGCTTAAQTPYGVTPDTSATGLCRTVTIPTAGNYQVYAISPDDPAGGHGTLYTTAGVTSCTNSGPLCKLAAGTYDFVLNEDPSITPGIGVAFIPASSAQGCTATGDSDFQSGDTTGTYAGPSDEACRTLPTASGKTIFVYLQWNQDLSSSGAVQFIVDATGAPQCSNADFTALTTCALTGSAPFQIVLQPGGATTYRVLIQRTDSAAGCSLWPQSGYGTSWGATVSLTKQDNLSCLSIPADQHSTGEMVDYFNNTNVTDGSINVFDTSGKQVCLGDSTNICSYTAGASYLALIYFSRSGSASSDTFRVVRRDTSQTASCATPASTIVGGPSTGFELTSDIDAVCYRVTAAAGDRLFAEVRTEAPYKIGAVLEVADATGKILCRQWGTVPCPVAGSAPYQVIVIASGYNGVSIAVHLDALVVGTAAGWAAQCTAHRLSAQGCAPTSTSLSESAASYCAVVTIKPAQRWSIYGAYTATPAEEPGLDMYSTADWSPGLGLCNVMTFDPWYSAGCIATPAGSGPAVLIATLGTVQGQTGLTFQGMCELDCATPKPGWSISAISAASQPQSTANQLVVTGTNLNLGISLELMSNGSQPAGSVAAEPISVNAAGTALTFQLDTDAVAPGKYDLAFGDGDSMPNCPVGGVSVDCWVGAYTVTTGRGANAAFHAVTPKRILDTRAGLGAAKRQIPANSAVTVTVTGVDGVATSGVSSVEMELTAVDEAASGVVVGYAYGKSQPGTSDLDFVAGQTVTNLVNLPVRAGKVVLYNQSSGPIDLVGDVVGYTAAVAGSLYTTVNPARILNTASGVGATKGTVAGHGTVNLTVAGVGGVPKTGVTAVALDLGTSGASAAGYLTAYASGATRPGVTDLSYPAGQAVRSLVVVPVSNGAIELYNAGAGALNLTADVEGYYSATGSGYQSLAPVRVLDTRSLLGGAGGRVARGGVAVLPFSALTGVPNTGKVTAEVLNVTVTAPAKAGTLTVTVNGQPLPGLANVAFGAGQTVADQVIVPMGSFVYCYDGSGGTLEVVADLEGYYTT